MRSLKVLYDELKGNRDTEELVTWFPPIEPPSKGVFGGLSQGEYNRCL
jgi:hypothetical protein